MKKLLDSLVKVETVLASVILAALILCTFSGVLARYCFSAPFTWEEEFQLACMVWITFLAAPVAFHTKSHVAIEILVDAFPKKVQRVMEICIFILMYAILIYFFFRSLDFIAVIAGTSRKTPILKIIHPAPMKTSTGHGTTMAGRMWWIIRSRNWNLASSPPRRPELWNGHASPAFRARWSL